MSIPVVPDAVDPVPDTAGHLEVTVTTDTPDGPAWPATRFWVDPAGSPLLMAAFAWASPHVVDRGR